MNWNKLTSETELDTLVEQSKTKPAVIFKHSNRCSISASALDRFERKWDDAKTAQVEPYFLDLVNYRSISNKVASVFEIEHESPQILIIKEGKCVYDASHWDISADDVCEQANKQ